VKKAKELFNENYKPLNRGIEEDYQKIEKSPKLVLFCLALQVLHGDEIDWFNIFYYILL
jgi:hypothetical protein